MKVLAVLFSVCIAVCRVSSLAAAEPALVLDVWPGKPADDDAALIGEEKFF